MPDWKSFSCWSTRSLAVMVWTAFFPFRTCLMLAMLIHGAGHVFFSRWSGSVPPLHCRDILEGVRLTDYLRSVICSASWRLVLMHAPQLSLEHHPQILRRWIALGGVQANLITAAAGLVCLMYVPDLVPGLYGMITLFVLASVLVGCSPDDWHVFRGKATAIACGPGFVVRARHESGERLSSRLRMLARIIATEAATRGGQSTGVALMMARDRDPALVFDKGVKGKREDIVDVFTAKLDHLGERTRSEGYLTPDGFEALLLHLRYATGGTTNWDNTQPHWYEYWPSAWIHGWESGDLASRQREMFTLIAHNGDMDGVYLDVVLAGVPSRRYFTQPEARAMLTRFMPVTTSLGNSDSRSVAEWADFHLCAGSVFKSLRYAWFTRICEYDVERICYQDDLRFLQQLADAMDELLVASQGLSRASLSTLLGTHLDSAVAGRVATTLRKVFIEAFLHAFFQQDLRWLLWRASRDLVGEFALMIASTLTSHIGVFARTQSFSLGYNRTLGEVFGSAEPIGVTMALQQGEMSDDARQVFLEDGQYALIDCEALASDPVTIYPAAEYDAEGGAPPVCTGWFEVNGNSKIPSLDIGQSAVHPVETDLADIPHVLDAIRRSFQPEGCNARTLAFFSHQLRQTLLRQRPGAVAYDLVVYGVDFNQDLLEEFAASFRRLIPGIDLLVENSGELLKMMKRQRREGYGPFDAYTVFLGISNSAQTQSTLAATRQAVTLGGKDRCFVMTQQLFNSMSQAIGQTYPRDAEDLPQTFVNLSALTREGKSCRRRAEAASLIVAATHATLTEVITGVMEIFLEHGLQGSKVGFSRVFPRKAMINAELERSDLEAFRIFQARVYECEIPSRLGFSSATNRHTGSDALAMEQEALARAENQLEYLRAYAIYVVYVVLATLLGAPLFAMLLQPFSFLSLQPAISRVMDAGFFVFGLWLILLVYRQYHGRPLWERMGARAEVYVDRRSIARIVERYHATLYSNMPAFLTPYFYWADTVQDALHRFGIRAHRGVITLHRIPDERMGIEEANAATEEQMVLSQLGGIQFNGGQPQSRYRVRSGSAFMRQEDPEAAMQFSRQSVVRDTLDDLRRDYQGKLSCTAMSLINRRLLDLSDGMVSEFVVGYLRFRHVNAALWDLVSWLPGASLMHGVMLGEGIDLRQISGRADTANQAQVQSTKHPVAPGDVHLETMRPRNRQEPVPDTGMEYLKWG